MFRNGKGPILHDPRSVETLTMLLAANFLRLGRAGDSMPATLGRQARTWSAGRGGRHAAFHGFPPDLQLPESAIEEISESARAGSADEYGVRQLELYYNNDGNVYCLLEAPSEEAVREHHAALGVPCGEVHQVDSIF